MVREFSRSADLKSGEPYESRQTGGQEGDPEADAAAKAAAKASKKERQKKKRRVPETLVIGRVSRRSFGRTSRRCRGGGNHKACSI
jgi:hypothetical protein